MTRIFFSATLMLVLGVPLASAAPGAPAARAVAEWPGEVQIVHIPSPADGKLQPALFYNSGSSPEKPLLVVLHSWSASYTQPMNIPFGKWCIQHDWVFIHPDFRGPNWTPQAMGSELAVGDILSAVGYAKKNARVDDRRIYLAGASGGGYASLLMAGRHPEIWAGVSAWVPVSNLVDWYFEVKERKLHYARNIVHAAGGAPVVGSSAEAECLRRSATTYLAGASGVPLDINAGIRDGHDGNCVPVSQSLRAYNLLAAPVDRFSEAEIAELVKTATVPAALRFAGTDATYGKKGVLLRRQSGSTRVTLFDGIHEAIPEAALRWLEQQQKRP